MDSDKIDYLPNGYFNNLVTINNVLFTAREIDIISCITHMRGSSKIASILDISPRTAETHIVNIKRKIDNSAREGVIDFIERSGKSSIVRKHYQNLLIQADFYKRLKSVSTVVHHNAPVCYFFCFNNKNKESIVSAVQNHLKLAGIQLIICKQETKIAEHKQGEHFIYVISDKDNKKSIVLEMLHNATRSINLCTFLAVEKANTNHEVVRELVGNAYIDFSGQKNYYLTIFKILERMLPNLGLDKIISQMKYYHQSITDQQGLPVVYPVLDLKKSNIDSVSLPVTSNTHRKWSAIILLILLIIIVAFGHNKMTSKKNRNEEASLTLLPTTNIRLSITSYIPEILTGYESFIGREKELQQIENLLNKENTVVITGRGGVGKSSMVAEYGKHHRQSKIVRYFHASSKTKIDQQYRELAQELNIIVDQQSTNLVMQLINNKLITIPAKVLFIFDNVDQYDDIKEYLVNLPTNIQVIITTRQPMLIANKSHVALEEFSDLEAEQYLNSSLQNRLFNEGFIREIIENTGTLPYDIKCAAAYLLGNPSIDRKTDAKKISNKIKNKLFYEFIISSDQIKQQAWKILQYAANLDPDFINMEIIKELFPKDVELSSAALNNLELLSLISFINDKNNQAGFRVHRNLQKNVQNSVSHYPEHAINKQFLTDNLLGALDKLFPEVIHSSNIGWKIAGSLQSHLEKILNTETKTVTKKGIINRSNLCYKLAKYHLRVHIHYHRALEYAKTALNQRYAYHKKSIHPDVANASNIIGIIYRRLGNIQEGLKHSKEGLKIRQQLYPRNHPDIADSLYNVGMAYKQQGETQKGLEYLQLALEINKQLYSGNNYDVAVSLSSIGMCYLDLGDFEKSLSYVTAGLNIITDLYPNDYDKIAESHSNLAYNYNKLGNYVEAIKYAQSSVDLIKKAYPDGHPVAIYSLNDLGESLIRVNNIKQGLNVLHQALDMNKKFSMDKHFSAAWILHDLGWGYLKNKKYHTALKYAEQALSLWKEIYVNVENHPHLAESLHNLGDINLALGNKNTGLQLYKEALAMYTTLSLEHLPETEQLKQKINKLIPH